MNAFCKLGKMSLKFRSFGTRVVKLTNFSSNRERWRKEVRRKRTKEKVKENVRVRKGIESGTHRDKK